jgi:DNA-binding transcriptional MerR regulator
VQDDGHTLDDLARATGFTKRQIRFYISKRLVPGAGDRRGPYTVYPAETLERLRAIKLLKDIRIEPTGRALTLDEIGHSLDTLSPAGLDALLSGRAELTILDTEDGVREPLGEQAMDEPAGMLFEPAARYGADDQRQPAETPAVLAQLRGVLAEITAERERLAGLVDELSALLERKGDRDV